MTGLLRIITDSLDQALHQLIVNKLRTFLSLLGITMGIFCIISVQSAVNSLEDNVRGSFNRLGNDVIYVNKFSWGEDPGQNWWKYVKRPNPSHDDYEAIKDRSNSTRILSYYAIIGRRTVKYRNNSVDGAFAFGTTLEYADILKLEFHKGRFFSPSEYYYAAPKVVLGYEVAGRLFGIEDPIGKRISLGGKKLEVVGVLEKSGEDLISILNYDEVAMISYPFGKQLANLSNRFGFGGGIAVKAKQGVEVDYLKGELTGILRAERRLKPVEDDNFSLNTLSLMSKVLDAVFSTLNTMGLILGIFAIIVGAISVANIMFVSVKERTNIIGIKKAIGARRSVILLEFLTESVILCLAGGVVGILLVWGVVTIISDYIPFDIYMGPTEALWGLVWSIGIGVVSGFIPALQAARMDPITAIRHK